MQSRHAPARRLGGNATVENLLSVVGDIAIPFASRRGLTSQAQLRFSRSFCIADFQYHIIVAKIVQTVTQRFKGAKTRHANGLAVHSLQKVMAWTPLLLATSIVPKSTLKCRNLTARGSAASSVVHWLPLTALKRKWLRTGAAVLCIDPGFQAAVYAQEG